MKKGKYTVKNRVAVVDETGKGLMELNVLDTGLSFDAAKTLRNENKDSGAFITPDEKKMRKQNKARREFLALRQARRAAKVAVRNGTAELPVRKPRKRTN